MKVGNWFRRRVNRRRIVSELTLVEHLLDPESEIRSIIARVVRSVAKDVAQDAMEPALERALQAFDSYVEGYTTPVSRETPEHECGHGVTCSGPTVDDRAGFCGRCGVSFTSGVPSDAEFKDSGYCTRCVNNTIEHGSNFIKNVSDL